MADTSSGDHGGMLEGSYWDDGGAGSGGGGGGRLSSSSSSKLSYCCRTVESLERILDRIGRRILDRKNEMYLIIAALWGVQYVMRCGFQHGFQQIKFVPMS